MTATQQILDFGRSLGARIGLLAVTFAAVPVVIYHQLDNAEETKRAILLKTLQSEGYLITQSLRLGLEAATRPTILETKALLERIDPRGMRVRLLFRPAAGGPEGAYLIAALPPLPPEQLDAERALLVEAGVTRTLPASCEGATPLDLRYRDPDGGHELLTSITPFTTAAGCWGVVTSHSTYEAVGSLIGRPWWQAREVRLAVMFYAVLALMVLLLLGGLWRSLRRFGSQARAIVGGGGGAASFSASNHIPELADIADAFDRMVSHLRQSAEAFRHAAEDNAHAFKTPIATIAQALEPLRGAIAAEDSRSRRALILIEASVTRLDALVSAARRMDEANACLVNPRYEKLDVSRLVGTLLNSYAEGMGERAVTLERRLVPGCVAWAGADLIETVVENILDNAIGFTPAGGVVTVTVRRDAASVRIIVEDEGPGVPAEMLGRIFDRYLSHRPASAGDADEEHFGIGLWIAKRNVEAAGGSVTAENRPEGGLRLTVTLRRAP